MGRAQQFLVPGKGGLSYVDTFGAVSPRWTLRAGTLAAGLQAATAGNWLSTMVVNGGFETLGAGGADIWGTWDESTAGGGTLADEGVIVRTGSHAAKLTNAVGDSYVRQLNAVTPAWSYIFNMYTRGDGTVAGRYRVRDATMSVDLIGAISTGVSGVVYTLVSPVFTIPNTSSNIYVYAYSSAAVGSCYFDDISVCRANTVATLAGWGSPNITATLDLPQPAAPSVVPFSFITRYVDALNYWEVRVTPNTAGNDLEIIEVVAGVATQRAAADIDWTAGQTDQMRVTVRGASIAVEHKKFGASSWTAGASYATMATGLTATAHGLMFFGTGVNRCTRWESHT